MAIRFPSICHGLTAISVFPIHCEVGAHLFSVVSFFLLVGVKLLSRRIDRSSDDSFFQEAGEYEPRASRDLSGCQLLNNETRSMRDSSLNWVWSPGSLLVCSFHFPGDLAQNL